MNSLFFGMFLHSLIVLVFCAWNSYGSTSPLMNKLRNIFTFLPRETYEHVRLSGIVRQREETLIKEGKFIPQKFYDEQTIKSAFPGGILRTELDLTKLKDQNC